MKELDLTAFPKISQQDWLQLAQDQLKGKDPLTELSWESYGISNLSPYYNNEDTKSLEDQIDFFLQLNSHRWKLYEKIEVTSEKHANKKAIASLMGGCDGIIFQVQGSVSFDSLLDNIDPSICDLSFFTASSDLAFPKVSGMRRTSDERNCVFESRDHASAVDQLVDLLNQHTSERFFHRTAFTDFFMEIASVRALRFLLSDIRNLSGVHIHSSIPNHSSDEHQWFLNTTGGLASILGGSHSIDLATSIGDSRITRNVGNLIRDESGIDQYEDQCGGSYLVEVLTNKIIENVKTEIGNE